MSGKSLSNNLCLFCSMPTERIVGENELVYAVKDGFPVTEGHTLVSPKRNVTDFFCLSDYGARMQSYVHQRNYSIDVEPFMENA